MGLEQIFQGVFNREEFNNVFNPDDVISNPDNPPVTDQVPIFDPEEPPSDPPPDTQLPGGSSEILLEKLDSVPVFTLTDAEGAPLVSTDDNGEKLAGIFISQEDANNFVSELQTTNPELAAQLDVVPVSLGEVYRLDIAEESSDEDLDFAYVPDDEAVNNATNILSATGETYPGGVPLFVARNENDDFLTIERDGQPIIPLFFDLNQLQGLVDSAEEELATTISIDVVPLEGVIATFETSDDPALEQIVLIPTPESLDFVQNNTENNNTENEERADIYRFFNQETGVHFYTASEAEKDEIIANLPNFTLEGVAYEAVDPLTGATNTDVVHRFRNQDTGVHVYTISETERNFIAENLTNYDYEGEVFAAYTSPVEGTIPIHRFYNPELDAHFYTPSEAERVSVENNLPNYDYEGTAYYAYPVD